nr:hypothetical protein [Tanacetum cinerariifolium]
DKKKIVISEVVIREILQLDDVEGVVCLPNEAIFAGLAQMGYEKPSTKLTSYKAFFSSQWKFLIHTILQSLSAKRTSSWNEFSTAMASAVICLSKGQKFNFSKYIFDSLVQNVDSSSKFYMYPRFIQLIIQHQVGDLSTHTTRFISLALTQKVFANMRRVRKGFSGVETPLFEGMLADRQPAEEGLVDEQVQVDDVVVVAVEENVAEDVAYDSIPSPPSHGIPSPSQEPSSPPQQPQSSPHAPPQVLSMQEDDSEVQEVVEVVTTVKLITDVVTAAASQVSAASTTISAAKPSIHVAASTIVAAYTRRRKGVIIRDPEEELPLKTPAETPKYIKRYQGMKKRPQTESEARNNIMLYLKNTAGYKMDFFKEMTYAEICPIFQARFDENMSFLFKSREEMEEEDQKIIKSINETPAQKADKRRKLGKEAQEAEDLRKRLEVVDDEDDDVFIEATPLARKVPVVDYQIVLVDNKPRFKIIKADETHRFYISFTILLKNFDKEDLENLWGIVKDRFYTSKPTNFSDEYLLLTLKTMFEKPDGQDAIWRNQKSVHGLTLVKSWKLLTSCGVHIITLSTVQLFLLVERRYLLSRFTLEQLVNVTRLQVEEERIELVADQEKDAEKDAEVEGRHANKQAKIYNIDLDHSLKVLSMQEDDTEVQEAVEVVTTAKLMTEVVTAAATQVAAANPEEDLPSDTPAETPKVKDKGKGILIEAPKPMKKKDQIEMDAEYARKLQEEINKEHEESYKNIDWNAAFDHVQSKEPQYIKRYYGIKKKPQTKSEARKNMIFYLRNTDGYKMEFFKGLTYDEILPIFQAKFDANMRFLFKTREEMETEDEEIIKSINETPAQKAAKRRKLHEQAKEDDDLKKQLEVVVDEDDDVYKIIRADDTHQLYTSFITLLKNFDREDLEDLWRIMKDRFSTSKPTNFSNDYLLSTLKTMFEKTDGQDAIWRNQQSVYGQALVKSWKLLTSCGVHIISNHYFYLSNADAARLKLKPFKDAAAIAHANSGSNPTMFQEMMQQQIEIERKEKMERMDRKMNSRIALNNSIRVAEDLKVLQMSTDGMDPIDAAIVNAQKDKIRALYRPDN